MNTPSDRGSGEWLPISEAPVCADLLAHDPPVCLVWSKETGIQLGRAWTYPNGQPFGQAFGFHGDWNITHWQPLPAPPRPTQERSDEG